MSVEKKTTMRSDIPYAAATDETNKLVVGRGIVLQGQIGSCDYLVIEGTVQAEGFAARRVDILEAGLFAGSADLQDCVIFGRFEGSLVVRGKLTVKPTGVVAGDIEYGVLEVEPGARVEGRICSIVAPLTAAQPVTVQTVSVEEVLAAAPASPSAAADKSLFPESGSDEGGIRPDISGRGVYRRTVG